VGTVPSVLLYGVINVSPDSLDEQSIATTPDAAVARARMLLAEGADALDVGGQGSTEQAAIVAADEEWSRLATIVPALAGLGVALSIDSWRPDVVRRALESGATVINAADGMQSDAMWEVAAEHDVPIVVPFLSGPDPRRMVPVRRDPIEAIAEFFEARLATADRYGRRSRCILDPGTGFAPPGWPWEERYLYQKDVYQRLGELRRFGLPLYVALPWKETAQHEELLEIVAAQQPEYGRSHRPAHVRAVEARVLGGSTGGVSRSRSAHDQ
jgi:dihydropteroate synthase